jgi:hypothetical protein
MGLAAVAGLIALVLFIDGSLEYPFSGGTRVGPEAFELVLERLEGQRPRQPQIDTERGSRVPHLPSLHPAHRFT